MNRLFALGIGIGILLVTATASAERPFTETKASLSAHLGYGAYLEDSDLNPYAFGFGLRGGYTFVPNIYVGGLFDFFLGESDEVTTLGVSAEESASAWLFQVEGGYDFGVSRSVVLRPKLGLGMTQVSGEGCATAFVGQVCNDFSDSEFAFGLGAEALFDLGPVYVAPEMRFNLGSDINALIFMVGVGGVL